MKKILEAIYKNGVFTPLERPDFNEGQQVLLIVEFPPADEASENILHLAAAVYNGLSSQDIKDIEQMATDRSHFFNPTR